MPALVLLSTVPVYIRIVHSILVHVNAFFCCCCCWNCLYLSFSSYRDNSICCSCCCCCSYCAVYSIPFWRKKWIREWGHSHFLLYVYCNDDGIESHYICALTFNETTKLIGIAQLSTARNPKVKFLNAMSFTLRS